MAGVFCLLGLGMILGVLILIFEHLFYKYTLPILRHKPKGTVWRSRNIMFFSQVSDQPAKSSSYLYMYIIFMVLMMIFSFFLCYFIIIIKTYTKIYVRKVSHCIHKLNNQSQFPFVHRNYIVL